MMDNIEIELNEFLNLLLLSCKASLKENSPEMKNVEIDLNELASNALVTKLIKYLQRKKENDQNMAVIERYIGQRSSVSEQKTAESTPEMSSKADNKVTESEILKETIDMLKNKLFELLNEGLFDSVLTYIRPNKMVTNSKLRQQDNQSMAQNKCRKKERKKKINDTKPVTNHGAEVEIHVYDEIKGHKRDFKCPQNLLISNMGYFSEITKGQKLEEMDISVHCDVTIFEWLMKWTKTYSSNKENLPKLECKNVIPIMVSADFLQMKPLFQDCLYYCKTNLNEIIKCSPNLTCLSDEILHSLAEKLSNTDVQYLKDTKDKIKSRLFCKLITFLNEQEPEKHRGHYASTAYLHICLNCGKLITKISAPYVPCKVQYITIKYNGDVIFNHSRNQKWNINEHIKNIWIEYKSWSNTYWRLWSQCHFLYCYMCRTMYAVAFADCCPYHPQQPHFYPIEQFQTNNSPIGRYPCCGSKALKYETIIMRSGCRLRSHIPKLQTNDDTCIQTIIDSFPDLIKIKGADENLQPFTDNYDLVNFDGIFENTFLNKNVESPRHGLLKGPLFESCLKTIQTRNSSDVCADKSVTAWESKNERSDENLIKGRDNADWDSIGESESSESSLPNNFPTLNEKKDENAEMLRTEPNQQLKFRDGMRPAWSSRHSVRHNQDNLRDFEEITFQALSEILTSEKEFKKIINGMNHSMVGSYAAIESEWKEMIRAKSNSNAKRKPAI